MLKYVSLAQAGYYVITGIWPLVSIRTFQMVTGPKTDLWLVKTVGALVAVIGAALGLAGLKQRAGPDTVILATGSAASLAAVDVIYVAKKRIAPVYLLDALAELGLAAGWLVASRSSHKEDQKPATK